MAGTNEFRVIVATDGSKDARGAVTTAAHFPWPAGARVRVVVARRNRAFVVGWRGHGAVRRALMGSVSRGIVRGAACAVLVVRRPQRVRRIVVGLDQTPHASRALAFVERLVPPAHGRVTLATAVTLTPVPSRRVALAAGALAREVKRTNATRARTASKELNRAAARLKRRGWDTRTSLTTGEPLNDVLGAVKTARAHLLVVGAKGTSRVRHLLLGSVAEGALNSSPIPVLVAR